MCKKLFVTPTMVVGHKKYVRAVIIFDCAIFHYHKIGKNVKIFGKNMNYSL